MNNKSKKLNEMEKWMLSDIPKVGSSKISFENGSVEEDQAEYALHNRATQILKNHGQRLDEAKGELENGGKPILLTELTPDEKAIVAASERILFHRIMEIFDAWAKCYIYGDDSISKHIFYMRFFWFINEVTDQIKQQKAEAHVWDSPGFFELCHGEQDRLLAPIYARWRRYLFSKHQATNGIGCTALISTRRLAISTLAYK